MTRSLRTWDVPGWSAAVLVLVLSVSAFGDPGRNKSRSSRSEPAVAEPTPPAQIIGLFDALDQQKIVAQVVPQDHTLVRVLLASRTNDPLQVDLPPAFGAIPVPSFLAQQRLRAQGINPGTANATATADGNSPQPLGVWPSTSSNSPNNARPGNPGQNRGLPFGNNNGRGVNLMNVMGEANPAAELLNVALPQSHGDLMLQILPGKSVPLVLHGVCLAYGRPTPTPRMNYQIKPLVQTSPKPEVRRLLTIVGTENVPQRIAQPAAWHLANNVPWEKLMDRSSLAGLPRQLLRFSPAEIAAAQKLTERAQAAASETSGATSNGT